MYSYLPCSFTEALSLALVRSTIIRPVKSINSFTLCKDIRYFNRDYISVCKLPSTTPYRKLALPCLWHSQRVAPLLMSDVGKFAIPKHLTLAQSLCRGILSGRSLEGVTPMYFLLHFWQKQSLLKTKSCQ